MKSLKKAVVLMLSILIILTLTNCSFARVIGNSSNDTNNTSNDANDTNNTENSTDNEVDNNTTNNTSNGNTATPAITNNTPRAINSSNVSENLPNTGLSSAELNLALILLLALVFGMFSLVQYNKIVKKDNEE